MAKSQYIPIAELSPEEQEKRRASQRKIMARHRATHREWWCAYARKWRAANKTKIAAWDKERRQDNPQLWAKRLRDWVERNREYVRTRQREWDRQHPDLAKARRARKKAHKQSAPVDDFTAQEWRALCKAMDYRCAYCGTRFPFKALEPDHLTPYAKQGSNTLHNILPACRACNSRKKDRAVLKPVQPFLLLPEEDAAAD